MYLRETPSRPCSLKRCTSRQNRLSKEFVPCIVRSFDLDPLTSFRTVPETSIKAFSSLRSRSSSETSRAHENSRRGAPIGDTVFVSKSCSVSRLVLFSSTPQRRTTSCNAVWLGLIAGRVVAGTRALLQLVKRNYRVGVTASGSLLSRETSQTGKHHKQFLRAIRPASVSVADVPALGEAQRVVGSQVDGCRREQNRLLRSTTAYLGALRNNALPIVEKVKVPLRINCGARICSRMKICHHCERQ